jgi:hypothetical protein
MSNNLSKIREALQRNNIVLENGELRVDEPRSAGPIAPRRAGTPPPAKPQLAAPRIDEVLDDAPAAVRIKPTTWASDGAWYTQPRFAKRFDAERAAVLAQMPSARLAVMEDDTLFWEMPVRTLGGTRYVISVVYPFTFPYGELEAYVLNPWIGASPHQFGGGRLCLGHAFGACTSAITTAAWTAAWLSAYEDYCGTGIWPEFRN